MVSDVTLSGVAFDAQSTQASSDTLATDFADFLNLLTVQLQNQDPLSPMETNEFTNQLVAFTGVEQQINTNQKLDSLVALSLGSSFSSALGYVGLEASYVSTEFYHDGSGTSEIKYALDSESFETVARVVNENGDIIYEEDVSGNTGSQDFVWDGLTDQGEAAPAGTYEIRIDALDFDGNAVGSTTVVKGEITGVETQDGVIYSIIGERAVAIGNILNASKPGEQTATSSDTSDTSEDDTSGES